MNPVTFELSNVKCVNEVSLACSLCNPVFWEAEARPAWTNTKFQGDQPVGKILSQREEGEGEEKKEEGKANKQSRDKHVS